MRPIGLLLCVAACTLDNPAFLVTDTEVGSASGNASTDPTRPTSTTSPATGEPNPTSATTDPPATTDPGTTTSAGDSDVTTDPPVTSTTTTTDATTTTTEPQPMSAATSDTTGPVSCGIVDVLPPQLPLLLADSNQAALTTECMPWQGKDYAGRLEANPGGFKVVPDPGCLPSNLPGPGFAFQLGLGQDLPAHNFECVKLRFTVHQDTEQCLVSALTVAHGGMPVLRGSFGRAEIEPGLPFQLALQPTDTCGACDGCCAPGPDPDIYTFQLADESVAEGVKQMFTIEGKKHLFHNLRSHVHAPECMDDQLHASDWLHVEWLVVRVD